MLSSLLAASTSGIVANVFFILWWTDVIRPAALLPLNPNQNLSLTLAPVWHALYWPVLALALAAVGLHSLRLIRDARSRLATLFDEHDLVCAAVHYQRRNGHRWAASASPRSF